MTNHWIDYQHSDVFMAIGGNPAENHPVSMKWIEKAREEKGSKLIVVDPRYTRTAAVADHYVPIRPGTNTAYISGLINYILENGLYHEEYVRHYTNASYLIDEGYSFDDVTGVFSGIEEDEARNAKKYNKETWQYRRDEEGNIIKDESMEDANSVFQILKRHYSSYTLDKVSEVTGCDPEVLAKSAEFFASTGAPGAAGNVLYAMGITQFTHGSQNVRSLAMLQLLLGNMGIAGGGVNAQRGQANVQGSTDMAMLYHIIPGYMTAPSAGVHRDYKEYLEVETPESGYWENYPSFFTSLLKAFYGENAREDNDYCFDWLPKLDDRDHSHIGMYKYMGSGEIEGFICWADNPAVSGPTSADKRNYMAELKWLVSIDIFENETASFWKAPGMNPEEIDTEVFLLPAANSFEREGSVANSGRWIQWRYHAQDPPGYAMSDLWIVDKLYKAIKKEYEGDGEAVFPEPITKLKWDYEGSDGEIDIEKVCMEINGYHTDSGELLANFTKLTDGGETACGNWIYSGYYNDVNDPACKRRIREEEGIGSNPDWAFAWPLNRRIVYNRCSSDPEGNPWNPKVPVVWWEEGEWKQNDVPDFDTGVAPLESAKAPFIMLPEGQGRLFSPALADGPIPVHYEPAESPVSNLIHTGATFNPISQRWYEDHLAEVGSSAYPYVISTYRVTEHWQTGIMTRNTPWLNEVMPELFIELSTSLAREKGIKDGDYVQIETYRNETIKAKACVTGRLKPLKVGDKKLEIVGMPFHWGYAGLSKGDVVNDIAPSIGDANTTIPEFKAFLCNIRKVS